LIQVYAYKLLPEGALSLQEPNKAIFVASHAATETQKEIATNRYPRSGVIEPGENLPVEASQIRMTDHAHKALDIRHKSRGEPSGPQSCGSFSGFSSFRIADDMSEWDFH
jgi:hypothetical protein